MNPYEAPQSTNQPLPVASVVFNVPPELAILAVGTARCARAGRFYLVATASCFLFVLCRLIMDLGFREHTGLMILMLFFIVVSVVFGGWGMLENITGMLSLRANLKEKKLRRNFTACLHCCWLKVPLTILYLIKPNHPLVRYSSLLDYVWEEAPVCLLLAAWALTVVWQTKGINALVSILGIARPRYTSMMYWLTGTLLIVGGFVALAVAFRPQYVRWYLVLIGITALHFLTYTRAYQQLTRALRTGVAT
jgi:hypothetical protein